ncbi:MAG: glycosyltransferase [Candidatus Thorarchaeota archaeon]
MTKKYDIIMFSMSDWNDWYKKGIVNRNYHILNQLLKSNKIGKILHVDFLPYTKKRALRSYFENQISNTSGQTIKRNLTSVLKKISEKLYTYSTIDSIFSENKVYKKLNVILKKLNFENIILWSYFPMFTGYFDSIESNIKIFDTVDNWIEHHNFKDYKKRLRKNYNIINQKADLIFTVSQDLTNLFPTNKNVHWISNGVDITFFQKTNVQCLMSNVKNIPHPIIGYVGIIQDRIDIDLIEYVAKNNSDKSIVLIGDIWPDANVTNLKQEKNVHFLNRVEYKKLPKYIHQFDVAIIPHKVNKFTKSMNPLKLYEYLACSKPVVTTPIAGIEKFKDLIYVASSKEEFNNKIQEALQNNNEELEKKRFESVKNYSWQPRINQMMNYIENLL